MTDEKERNYGKNPSAGKGGSPASSTPNEENRASESGESKHSSSSHTPREGKDNTGGKG